jgi:hypothetical protein
LYTGITMDTLGPVSVLPESFLFSEVFESAMLPNIHEATLGCVHILPTPSGRGAESNTVQQLLLRKFKTYARLPGLGDRPIK